MAEGRVQRRLAAILAADIVGYSRLIREDETGTRARFNAHLHDLIEPTIARYRGRIVKTTGDGFIQPDGGTEDAFVHTSTVERAGLPILLGGQKCQLNDGTSHYGIQHKK